MAGERYTQEFKIAAVIYWVITHGTSPPPEGWCSPPFKHAKRLSNIALMCNKQLRVKIKLQSQLVVSGPRVSFLNSKIPPPISRTKR